MSLSVLPFTDEHLAAAGALLAARQVRQRARFPLLPSAFEDAGACAELVARTASFSRVVVALDGDGGVAGFLSAFRNEPDPSEPMARYVLERSATYLAHGHAVGAEHEPAAVYPLLFAALADAFLAEGVADHVAHVPIGDAATEAAWVALGFGRWSAVAVRSVEPVGRPVPAGLLVRVATPDDLDVVERLVDEESRYHARSPMFRPYVGEQTRDAVRAELIDELASDDHAFLLARLDGEDVGVLAIGPRLGSPICVPTGAAYIGSTAVVASLHGGGVGSALVDAALGWAHDHGHVAVCLHYATANARSTGFWTGIGFVPVMVHLCRRLDPRVAVQTPGNT